MTKYIDCVILLAEVGEKSPSAIDYSDINEVVEDDTLAREEDDGKCQCILSSKHILWVTRPQLFSYQ